MPFADPINGYFPTVFRPALQAAGFDVMRADDPELPTSIIEDIRAQIKCADMLLCEMTDKNANVFYELGMAHAIGKPVILLAQSMGEIPFDLSSIRTIIYDPKQSGWKQRLKQRIKSVANEIKRSNFRPGLPPLIETRKMTITSHLAGVHKVSTGASRAESFRGIVQRSTKSLSILGIGMTNITKYAKADLSKAALKVPINFLMLDPRNLQASTDFSQMLHGFLDMGNFKSHIEDSYNVLKQLCETNNSKKGRKRMSLRIYSTIPTMSMVMIDERIETAESEVEFFIFRAGGSRPRLSVKKLRDGEGAFELFHRTFRELWNSAERVV